MLTFKDYKGFHKIDDIREKYKLKRTIGKGSFGEVRAATLKAMNLECAIKSIKKSDVHRHKVLVALMRSELEILEEAVSPHTPFILEPP